MDIAILTNEYPPNVYGGAGVHVEYLTRALKNISNGDHRLQVLAFGDQQIDEGSLSVRGFTPAVIPPFQDSRHRKLMETLQTNLFMNGSLPKADILHCHTWYSHLAGLLLKNLLEAPLVLSTHSLEPHRPWKAEQLGSAYRVSSWIEKTAYQNADGVIAVSEAMKKDVQELYGVREERIRVIHNGIDLQQYRKQLNPAILQKHGIDSVKPFVLFVGRITRQKGIIHLVNAIHYLEPEVQVVLCAGAPDTPEIGREMENAVAEARRRNPNPIVWIPKVLPKEEVIALYSHAALFVCPSVYEPFGIINLEAMACETPVVGTAVGGIPEIIVPGETGTLVPLKAVSVNNPEPADPQEFSRKLASAINELMANSEKRREMGIKARRRVEEKFSWDSIAKRTLQFYQEVVENKN
ncbi:MAG: glycogen synthase [Calditrichia bacterium]